MRLVDNNTGIEVLDRGTCVRLMATQPVGRLAVAPGGRPVCLPVNFVLDDEAVVFRTAAGTKLDAAVRGALVSFEVDSIDPVLQAGWSVVVSGWAEEVLDADEQARLAALPLRPWSAHDKSHWIRVRPESITGRRLRPLTDAAEGGT